jgi:outer membrane immunogenic protein
MRAVAWGVLLASWSGIALAADLPPPMMPAPPPVYVPVSAPTYNWTSIYLGGNVGYGFAKATATASAAAFGVGASASTSETLNGVLGGGQVGALYQFGYGVVGLESDFDGTGQSTSTTVGGITATDKIPWLSTTRVRVGAAYDRVLFYLTGGGGWGQFSTTVAGGGASITSSQWQFAWVGGGGVEYGFTQNLSARIEYLYVDTGNVTLISASGGGANASISGRVQENIVRAGLNFRLPL